MIRRQGVFIIYFETETNKCKMQKSVAASMINNDQLKKILSKDKPGAIKSPQEIKLLPRNPHSAFGDFPAKSMPKKST